MSDHRDDDAPNLPALRQQSSLANAEQRKTVAEVQGRIAFARHNPRNEMYCKETIERDCTRPRLAETAIYEYARGGTDISGPSIRLMETIARRWGNMASGIREVYRDSIEGFSECVAFAWDLESNYYDEREFVVRHWRDTKAGGYRLKDERDIYEMIANFGQRRKRACLIAVIPGDVVEDAVSQCERTLNTHVDMKPETITRLVEAFAEYGVTRKQIETRIQRKLDAIHPAQVVQLRKIYTSLKDGMSEASEWFPAETTKAWEEVERRQAANVVKMPSRDDPPPPETTQKKAPAKKAAVRKGQETSEKVVNNSPDVRMQEKPANPPNKPAIAQFEAYLLDAYGEPVDDEPITDPHLFLERLADLWTRTDAKLRIGLEEHNADSIQDARQVVPEELDIFAQIQAEPPSSGDDDSEVATGSKEETPKDRPIEVITVKQEGGRPNYSDYTRNLREALGQAGPEMFLDVLAPQKPTIDALPTSARLLAIKAIVEAAEQHGLEPPAEFRQTRRPPPPAAPTPPPPVDREAGYCEAHIAEMERATTLDYLRGFATSTAVTTRYRRWQNERPELAERMDQARTAAEQRLKAAT
jgi:hypothetical protein